mmetsp:Transcript_5122/g.12037  ORF Transcript_5122/g.12037 Transcript_5122/m.12037 type:complete len:341 (+) Transcript_5122:46-1068(+)
MDAAVSTGVGAFGPAGTLGGFGEALVCTVVAALVLRLELGRRAGPHASAHDAGGYAESCKRILRECAPEAAGIVVCLTLAAALRARGDTSKPLDDEAWAKIKEQWPLLLTADTLLSLQAMLRLIIFVSVVLRAGNGRATPLSEEAAALFLGGGLARVLGLSRSSVYALDGPLGGYLPAACEVGVIPLLFILGRSTLRRAPLASLQVAVGTVTFAFRNRLCLADDPTADTLFMAAHCFDFLAAFSYLLRALLIDDSSSGRKVRVCVGFTHLLLPIQQALSAYYFLQAFDAVPELVGSGSPFQVLQIGNAAQLGVYCGAAAVFVADCFTGSSQVTHAPDVQR